jgi:putative transposase
MARKRYPSDLTAAQWRRIEPYVPAPKDGGRPATVDRREIVNAVLYVVREGCSWRALPGDFPAWQTVYHYFRLWRDDGTWQQLHDALRDEVRAAAGRDSSPSAAILDAQSVKTAEKGGPVAATTPARRSKAASVTSPSIRSDCS